MGKPNAFSDETPAARDITNSFVRARLTQNIRPASITMIGIASRMNDGERVLASAIAFIKVMFEEERDLIFSIVSTKNINNPIIKNTRINDDMNLCVKYQ